MKRFATTRRPRQRLLVFARVPELGHVKTRLASSVGEEQALNLYRAMLQDVLDAMDSVDSSTEVEVLWTAESNPGGEVLSQYFGERELTEQSGPTLGERLSVAFFDRAHFHDVTKIVAIGADDPAIQPDLIRATFDLLDSCDWVVGPARDGGYYLIGCRAEAFDSAVFSEIPWGTSGVLAETVAKIRKTGRNLALLQERFDLDLVEDLKALLADHSRTAPRTRKVAQGLNLSA